MAGRITYIAGRVVKNAVLGMPGVSRLIRRRSGRRTGSMYDPEFVFGILNIHLRALAGARMDLRGLRTLELGPGNSLAQAFLLRVLGAERALAVDVERYATPESSPGVYRACLDGLERWLTSQEDLRPFLTDDWEARARALLPDGASFPVLGPELDYRITGGRELPAADGAVDLVYSCSVLEHVADPAGVYAEMSRVLRPGGLMSGVIDVSDHLRAGTLDHLKYGDRLWSFMQSRTSGATNRLRAADHLRLIESAGFEILSTRRRLADAPPAAAELAPRFQSYPPEELRTLAIVLSARRLP